MNHSIYIAVLESFVEAGYLPDSYLPDVNSAIQDSDAGQLKSLLLKGHIPEMAFAQTLSRLHQLPLITANSFPDVPVDQTVTIADFLKQHEVLPLGFVEGDLSLAMVDPADDFVIRVLSTKLGCRIRPHVAQRSELLMALTSLYLDQHIDSEAELTGRHEVPDDIESESALVREVHRVLQRGIAMGASDIHFEPRAQGLNVRYRIAGLMQQAHRFNSVDALAVLSRIKLMAGLDVTQRRLPQDGRFKFPADGQVLDLRIATMPLHNGESLVIRLLDPVLGARTLVELGYSPALAAELENVIERRYGLVLVTGPTGSGKSTTLYSMLNQLKQTEIKVISIENPVEIVLPGINQIQVDEAHGIGFASALRSVLRQDPDVIMVGEIRDAETARLAAQAALTGHLVFSTLHTSTAVAAVTRLRDLGLADFLITETLSAVVAQRLVRVSCVSCAEGRVTASCTSCYGSGFSRRTAIAELLECTAGLNLTLPPVELEAALQSQLLGQATLADEAQRLFDKKVISQAEMSRVLGGMTLNSDYS